MTALRPERGSESPWEEDEPQQGVYRDPADPADPPDPVDPRDPVDPPDPGDPRDPRDPGDPGDSRDPVDRRDPTARRSPVDRRRPVDPLDALELDPLDPLGLGTRTTPDSVGQHRREAPLPPPSSLPSSPLPVDPRPLERLAGGLRDEDTRVLNRRELGLGEPAPRGGDPEESSDTITLRVPPPVVPPETAPQEATPPETAAAAAAAVGGRAERRRAEQQARRRGVRAASAGAATGKGPQSKESAGIVAVRIMGELFITLGVVMFLFVAYQLWWTNVEADAYASGSAKTLEKQWAPPDGGTGSGIPPKNHAPYPSAISAGTKFALIYIPKLDVMTPIAEGVDKDSILDKGLVGHYTGALETAFPWDKTGNFALAGHRNTHGEPFRYINRLVPGDKIVVETAYDYYTYTVTSTLPQTSPSDVGVIAPVPPESGFKEPGRYITLTTCTPEFTSKYRMAVWGKLTQDLPKSSGQKPQALQTG